jgi:hypothetical protein
VTLRGRSGRARPPRREHLGEHLVELFARIPVLEELRLDHPFRSDLAAAVELAERLARENAVLRAKLAVRRLDWAVWAYIAILMVLGAVAETYIFSSGR